MRAWPFVPSRCHPLDRRPDVEPGDHTRTLKVDGRDRSYLVHVPGKYDGKTPMPVVLALHGAAMNGPMMAVFCGLNKKADEAGFIAVYPSGAGMGIFLTWNAGASQQGSCRRRGLYSSSSR